MSRILAAGAARMKLEAENYEARIAALEAQLDGMVRAKPLDWVFGETKLSPELSVWLAGAPGLNETYSVWHSTDPNATAQYTVPSLHNGFFDTLDEAKAAAQADYERRILSALASHPRATNTVDAHETLNVGDKPEGQQEPVAWEGYWSGAGSINSVTKYTRSKQAASRWEEDGANVTPLYTRPSEQAVTEAMVDAATEAYFTASFKNTPTDTMRIALKAAMEAGHD